MGDLERAERIKRLREDSGLTQPEVAERIGIGLRGYQKIEQTGGLSKPTLQRLAALHAVDEVWLRRGEPDTPELSERLVRIEAAIAEIKQILDDDLTGGVLPLLGDLVTRDGESGSTTPTTAPTQDRQRQTS